MQKDLIPAQILDLTEKQTLFELAIEEDELVGQKGVRMIAELKEKAFEAEYTHLYYRDPIRPGVVWFSMLNAQGGSVPTRGKLDACRAVCDRVFPKFLNSIDPENEEEIMAQIPPLTLGVTGIDLATALEYLVFAYPKMVRAWATLLFTYEEILGFKEASDAVRADCATCCEHPQVVAYLVDGVTEGTS